MKFGANSARWISPLVNLSKRNKSLRITLNIASTTGRIVPAWRSVAPVGPSGTCADELSESYRSGKHCPIVPPLRFETLG